MGNINPYIYVDYTNNIWYFTKNGNNELCYKIMYADGKWTKENIIDKDVLLFTIYINEDESIHIVYVDTKKEVKYCTMQDKKWVGRLLYQIEDNEFDIAELKMTIIEDEMHIFYVLVDKSGNDHGILTHCMWNGKETKKNVIQDIILSKSFNECYTINVNKNFDIDVLFVSDEGDEISLNYCKYQNKKWNSNRRLYGIEGDDISFEVFSDDDEEIHILNKFKDESLYLLDYVCIDLGGDIKEFKVHESNVELMSPILFYEEFKLYSCWIEQGKIYYSSFENNKWTNAVYFDRKNENQINMYNCFFWYEEEGIIKEMKVYGTNELDMNLFIPNNFVLSSSGNNITKYGMKIDAKGAGSDGEETQNLKIQIAREKSEKVKLSKKVNYLNIQLQKKERMIEEYEERISTVLEQKRKVDENYNVFLELQQNIQKELNSSKKKLKDEERDKEKYKSELEALKEELQENSRKAEEFSSEYEDINKILEEEKIAKAEMENTIREKIEENIQIKNELAKIKAEKEKLYEELEIERNQSIMDRLLRKRPNGI